MLVAVDSRDIGHDFAQYFCKQRHHCGNRQHLLLMRACADGLFYASASLASCRNAVIARNDVSRLTAYRRHVELTQPTIRGSAFLPECRPSMGCSTPKPAVWPTEGHRPIRPLAAEGPESSSNQSVMVAICDLSEALTTTAGAAPS